MVAITEMGNYRGIQKDYHREQFEESFGSRWNEWDEDYDEFGDVDNWNMDDWNIKSNNNNSELNEFECESKNFNVSDIGDGVKPTELIDTEWESYCPNICKYVEEGKCYGKHYWCGAFDEEDMN